MPVSQNDNWRESKIPLSQLVLWDENARFPDKYFSKSEKELIEFFCNKKNFKIEGLAKEIINDFDLPQVEKLIIYDTDEQNIVLEGNRRLTVYKLLNNPNLAPNDTLKKKFVKLKQDVDIDDSFSFDCLVTKNKAEGYRYIERKHIKGNNEVGWNEQERTHHNYRRGNATKKEQFKVAIAKIIKELDIPEELKERVLGHGYVTTFWRILDSSSAWEEYGFELKDGGELEIQDENFKDKLKVIILNVLKKEDFSGEKIDSRSLNTKDKIGKYIESITDDNFEQVKTEIERGTKTNLFNESSTNIAPTRSKTKINPKSTTRNHLIPKNCQLVIEERKINNIFRELRDDLLLDDTNKSTPNAVGVLFRVFLEICLDYFWEKKTNNPFPKKARLHTKVTEASNFMENHNIATAKQLHNIRLVAKSQNSLLTIENFHSYVHSYKTQPSSSDLKLKWDNLQEFFEILWGSLAKKNQGLKKQNAK